MQLNNFFQPHRNTFSTMKSENENNSVEKIIQQLHKWNNFLSRNFIFSCDKRNCKDYKRKMTKFFTLSYSVVLLFVCFIFKGELMFLNEATLLDNIKNRYYKDKIYVSFMSTSFISCYLNEYQKKFFYWFVLFLFFI